MRSGECVELPLFDRFHLSDLLEEIVVPLSLDLDVRGRTLQDCVDEIVVQVHVEAGLLEGVEGGSGGTSRQILVAILIEA